MAADGTISFIISGKSYCFQSTKLIQDSVLLTDLNSFCDDNNEAIRLPKFSSVKLIKDIILTLETKKYDYLERIDMNYLILLIKTSDFLLLQDVTEELLRILTSRLTIENCFELFRKINTHPAFQEVANTTLALMVDNIHKYYEYQPLLENLRDPYIERYSLMNIEEIERIMFYRRNLSIVTKILILQHWWLTNQNVSVSDEVFRIMYQINEEAAYITKVKIIFMRRIRDKIVLDVQKTSNACLDKSLCHII